jgi:hypothetical protein
MKNATEKQDQTEEIMLVQKVFDEALEVAAGAGDNRAGKYTFFYCTALDLCPGP